MQEWTVPAWLIVAGAGLVVVLAASLVVTTVRARRRTDRVAAAARADAEALQAQVAAIESRLAAEAAAREAAAREVEASREDREYVITALGRERTEEGPAPALPAPAFTDLVLRESAVQLAALAAGVRRALAPETRNRIRFEMGREVKRARRQRRADLRRARRDLAARQRADLDPGDRDRGAA